MKRSTRREIAKNTLKILEDGFYINEKGKKIDLRKAQKNAENNTKVYTPQALIKLIEQAPTRATEIQTEFVVNDLTTLDAVRKEYSSETKLICLNFASARNPGGGFLNGSQAQEESIARATGLYKCQLRGEEYYKKNRQIDTCLYTDYMIYAPIVPILKDELGRLLEQPSYVSIITAPAVNTGVVLRNEPTNIEKIAETMRRRIEMVLAICHENHYKTIVLGAWGCGVFRNDPKVIAKMFKEQLTEKYKNVFDKVVFAIYSKEERFITPFRKEFEML